MVLPISLDGGYYSVGENDNNSARFNKANAGDGAFQVYMLETEMVATNEVEQLSQFQSFSRNAVGIPLSNWLLFK